MAYYNKAIKGSHFESDKIKFTGSSTARSTIWKCSGNTFQEIYNKLVDMGVVSVEDSDPVYDFILGKLKKSYSDYFSEDAEEIDFDKLYSDGASFLTDEAYREIISNCDGNAYYQDFEIE